MSIISREKKSKIILRRLLGAQIYTYKTISFVLNSVTESPTAHMYWQACQSPALQVPYSDQSVRRLLRLRLLVRRVPLGRGCAGDLNHCFSRFNVEVIAELYIKSLSEAYLLFIWSNTAHTSLTQFKGQDQIGPYKHYFFQKIQTVHLGFLGHTSHKQSSRVKCVL